MNDVGGSAARGFNGPSRPLVSVIIPCYKQAHFLSESIQSALRQTHQPIEVVVVDDGSPDNTAEVVKRYPEAIYIRQVNHGLSGARNAGFRASHGEYVIFLDADDRLTANSAEAHLRCFAEHPEAGFVVGDIDHISFDGEYVYSPRWPMLHSKHYQELLKVNHVANTIAVMFRRLVIDTVGGFKAAFTPAEDYELLLYAARSFPSAHHRNVVAQYRRHGTSTSRNGAVMLRVLHQVMDSQRLLVKGNPQLEAARRRGANYWREHFGKTTLREIYMHGRRGNLIGATGSFLTLLWHVRGRLFILPWKYRKRFRKIFDAGGAGNSHAQGRATSTEVGR